MRQIELRGSYGEMGHQQGYPLKHMGMTLPPPDPKMIRFAKQCEEIVGQYAPELLEEMRGLDIAAGHPCQVKYQTVSF
jgi:hypothetical protein